MVNKLKKYASFGLLLLVVIAANWFISDRNRVEIWYSEGVYLSVSSLMRFMFGALPFSLGDIFYVLIIILLSKQSIVFIGSIIREPQKLKVIASGLKQSFITILLLWVVFNCLWGFNYYRKSIPDRFELSKDKVTQAELAAFAKYSLAETNRYAKGRRLDHYQSSEASIVLAYDSLSKEYPSLYVKNYSHKASMFGEIGNYMGFGGYYNPFTGEAQINDRMPAFLLPFISLHEIAHQMGNAKESEANFIGYLAAMHSADSSILYSANLELFLYAARALKKHDTTTVKKLFNALSPIAKNDIQSYEEFVQKYYGPVDRFVTSFYTGFLRINNQPEGMYSYNKGMIYVMRYLQKKGRIDRPIR